MLAVSEISRQGNQYKRTPSRAPSSTRARPSRTRSDSVSNTLVSIHDVSFLTCAAETQPCSCTASAHVPLVQWQLISCGGDEAMQAMQSSV